MALELISSSILSRLIYALRSKSLPGEFFLFAVYLHDCLKNIARFEHAPSHAVIAFTLYPRKQVFCNHQIPASTRSPLVTFMLAVILFGLGSLRIFEYTRLEYYYRSEQRNIVVFMTNALSIKRKKIIALTLLEKQDSQTTGIYI